MQTKIRNRQDLYAGTAFLFFGLSTLLIGSSYPIGTAARMGPGFFPSILGGILTVLGLGVIARSMFGGEAGVSPVSPRPLILILAAVISFALLVERFGLASAIVGLVLISSLAGPEFGLRRVILLCVVLMVMGVAVFAYALGLPFKVWPL